MLEFAIRLAQKAGSNLIDHLYSDRGDILASNRKVHQELIRCIRDEYR